MTAKAISRGITTEPVDTEFVREPRVYNFTIPAGMRCILLEGGTENRWVLDQFPPALFAPGSFVLHDAKIYGVDVPADKIRVL